MTLTVSGVDMTPYIARNGLKWQRADVDGPNAGRLMNGDMERDLVATKIRFDVTCRPLTGAELARILQAINGEYVTVRYTNPMTNGVTTGTFYSNNYPATLIGTVLNGQEYWSGLTFPLVQK